MRVTEGKTWQEAFLQVLPERKNAQPVLKDSESNSDDSQSQKETDQVEIEGETTS